VREDEWYEESWEGGGDGKDSVKESVEGKEMGEGGEVGVGSKEGGRLGGDQRRPFVLN